MNFATLTLPVPYREAVRTSRATTVERTAFAIVDVEIREPSILGGMSELAATRLNATDDVRWVHFEGRSLRPLLRESVEPAGRGIGFRKPVKHWWRWEDAVPRDAPWPDYPFGGWVPNGDEAARAAGPVVWNDLPSRLVQVEALARGLLYRDGVIYKPAPLPAWTVEDLRETAPGTARLSLVLPDLERSAGTLRQGRASPPLGLFAVGDTEAALRMSVALFGDGKAPGPRGRRRPIQDMRPHEFAYMRRPFDQSAATASGTLGICRRVAESMAGRDTWEMGGPPFEAAIAAFEASRSALAEAVRRKGHPLEPALDAVAAASDAAAAALYREVRPDDETLFLLRAASLTRRVPRPEATVRTEASETVGMGLRM